MDCNVDGYALIIYGLKNTNDDYRTRYKNSRRN